MEGPEKFLASAGAKARAVAEANMLVTRKQIRAAKRANRAAVYRAGGLVKHSKSDRAQAAHDKRARKAEKRIFDATAAVFVQMKAREVLEGRDR